MEHGELISQCLQNENLSSAIPEYSCRVPRQTHSLVWRWSVYLITQTSELRDAEASQLQETSFWHSQNIICLSASWAAGELTMRESGPGKLTRYQADY